MTKKYYVITYGCQMNKSDSERIAAVLEKIGYKPTSKINEADLIVINMCSVRQSAVDRVYGFVQKLKKLKTRNPKLKTILTGCVLKKDRKKFAEKFDFILKVKDLPKWQKTLNKIITRALPKMDDRPFLAEHNYLRVKPEYENKFSADIPIMTGCNNFCSYCVVPYVRGKEVSRPAKEIICEVKNLVKRGYKEIWLLGQNVNSYKNGNVHPVKSAHQRRAVLAEGEQFNGVNFAKLLKMVNNIPGDFWLRFTSPHPKDFSEELINTMAECEKYGHYLNLPVQAGDDKILKKMNRSYTIKQYKSLVKKIRRKIPNITLSTDIIVGFPGETKKQFENSKKLFEEIKYDMAYISEYSSRPGTAAAKIKDDVSKKEKARRKKVLTEILKKTALKKNQKYIGKTIEVLIAESAENYYIGKTKEYKTIKIINTQHLTPNTQNLIGRFIKVEITDALPWGLKGKIKKPPI